MLRRREPSWSPGKGDKDEKYEKKGEREKGSKKSSLRSKKLDGKQELSITPGRNRLRQESIVTTRIKRLNKTEEKQVQSIKGIHLMY